MWPKDKSIAIEPCILTYNKPWRIITMESLFRWNNIDINSSKNEKDQFYKELIEIVDFYVMHPKPRGQNNARSINSATNDMLSGLRAIGRCRDISLLIEIVDKLIDAKDYLAGPSFSTWITHICRFTKPSFSSRCENKDNVFIQLLEYRPEAFELFLDDASEQDILSIAQGIKGADIETLSLYENLVMTKRGTIPKLHELLYNSVY